MTARSTDSPVAGGRSIAVVTDSTAGLSAAEQRQLGIGVVRLHVLADGHEITADSEGSFPMAAAAAKTTGTSRPSPGEFLTCYENLASRGVQGIVSVHLSSQLSGTRDAALLAARSASVPVHVIDSAMAGAGLGNAVRHTASIVAGLSPQEAGEAARGIVRAVADATSTFFYVHSLENLRKGGRIGAAAAFLGAALSVKPILQLTDGHIEPVEKLRTTGRAVSRLIELAVSRARQLLGPVTVTVQHVDATERADLLAEKLTQALITQSISVASVSVAPVDEVLAVHVGPGAVGVFVTGTPTEPT
ncbi:DegV family protein [Dermatophilus congolensis]|uniref:DegV domain-containing protein SAV0749 n=1 Tax=Dermatophilus congolensis TaxID=1863 RepID=A0A239VJB5_9MICO|nr:DegV family protein [Dermatophilus congolensis]MBO3129228.1 DegV family protein [Dermatophilus congolensis]MBO3132140.1 DegV family protein [Dermatophilus congolensis]MBO3133704.1 DegV family protein [Dermatophilus congolensis]MBO3135937.1 DegV family protein [Dermatophilus congolensis]MBO3138177.1 DegV family protein [Dermatophilus congolensis]